MKRQGDAAISRRAFLGSVDAAGVFLMCRTVFAPAVGASDRFPNLLLFVSVFLVNIFVQAISVSTVVHVLLSEIYPNKVQGVAMSVAGFAPWVGTCLIGQFTPWCMATLGSLGTFFFAAMCLSYLAIIRFLVPETTGKSLEEIEEFWKRQERKD